MRNPFMKRLNDIFFLAARRTSAARVSRSMRCFILPHVIVTEVVGGIPPVQFDHDYPDESSHKSPQLRHNALALRQGATHIVAVSLLDRLPFRYFPPLFRQQRCPFRDAIPLNRSICRRLGLYLRTIRRFT